MKSTLCHFNKTIIRNNFTFYIARNLSSNYSALTKNKKYNVDYQIFLKDNKNSKIISPFHDIPLFSNKQKKIYNMVVEIPRWTSTKFEINKKEKLNPISYDLKKNKLRYVPNCFPYHGYLWNYGSIPQTWENPTLLSKETNTYGDNDPLDIIEIGQSIAKQAEIKQVKILGVMAFIDEGETDWKLVGIDINDPFASKLNDIEDVKKYCPGLIENTRRWFEIYKIPDGKKRNIVVFNGEFKNKEYAYKIIQEAHLEWKKLITGKIPRVTDKYDINVENTTLNYSPYKISPDNIININDLKCIIETENKNKEPEAWTYVE
ncbi:inorganic pyrophosphatase [Anaeromyces robustus]|uniref:Inorganic pyrophosphatase n=1 Tax=Anaeromyces robustus TaxID=1754192 RepID=A0A1Y1WXS5_9FUNG|nr:inorganic pyrophosphatase [Anaeromyces robustus]|eukprot:ORX78185.1 inorganic pyrophosphatase [Anaeromyces robustus]